MSMWLSDDELPPLDFGSRGFVTHDGQIIGWSLLSGDHNAYHAEHGTSDADFKTRWRKWSKREPVDLDATVSPAEAVRLEVWLERNADELVPMPRGA